MDMVDGERAKGWKQIVSIIYSSHPSISSSPKVPFLELYLALSLPFSMAEVENTPTSAAADKKPSVSTLETDLTKYKVSKTKLIGC